MRLDNSIEGNLEQWDRRHEWSRDGDEWDRQADVCGVSYEVWKQSLLTHLVEPYLGNDVTALEVAPGHGRWSQSLIDGCSDVVLVDLSPSCIAYCRERFADHEHVEYRVTDGRSLPDVSDESVDFVWSFDSFVHIEPEAFEAYLGEFRRVLVPGGRRSFIMPGAAMPPWVWAPFDASARPESFPTS